MTQDGQKTPGSYPPQSLDPMNPSTLMVLPTRIDPLSQRTPGAEDGLAEDMLARTIELLHTLRSVLTGPFAAYLWGALLVAGGGLAFQAWHAPASPGPTLANHMMVRVEGHTLVAGSTTWHAVDAIPSGAWVTCQGPKRTVLRLGQGTTIRLEAASVFSWHKLPQEPLVFTLGCGQAWLDLKETVAVAFPGGTAAGDGGTVAEVSIWPGETRLGCRQGLVTPTLPSSQAAPLGPGHVLLIAPGNVSESRDFRDDPAWERWNLDWATQHPGP